MKKIVILSLHMKYGGIEKAICSLVNMLSNSYEVEIINTYQLQEKPAFDIDEKVKVSYVLDNSISPNKEALLTALKHKKIATFIKEATFSIMVLYKKYFGMKKAIKNIDADIIISSNLFFHSFAAKFQANKLLIAWEHNHHYDSEKYKRKVARRTKKFDYFLPVSSYLKKDYEPYIHSSICMNLPLCIDFISDKTSNLTKKQLTVVGRLSKEKGYDDLLLVFQKVLLKEPSAILNIVGDGVLKEELKKMAEELNINKSVVFHGYKKHDELEAIYLNTSVFLTTSHYESFGLVILEAMNYGIPCISFSSAKGSLDMIVNDKNGFIIDNRDIMEMANKVIWLLKNSPRTFSDAAKNTAQRYSFDSVKKIWLSFLEKAYVQKNKQKKVMFVASAGGHFSELICLKPMFDKYDSYFLTEKNQSMLQYKEQFKEKIFYLPYGTKEEPFKYMFIFPFNIAKSFYYFCKVKPDYIITTGAHTAVGICYIAKLFRKKVVYIETYANIKTRSLTGRLIYPIADLFLVQWEEMLKLYPKSIYKGWLP